MANDLAPPRAAINEAVDYVSPFRTGIYDAIVRARNPDGTVAIDVYLPGSARGRKLYEDAAIRLRSVSYGPEGRARPRR